MECTICLEPYNVFERVPRVLPCGHSFCTTCLVGLVQGRAVQRIPEFDCPACRTTVRIRQISVNYAARQGLDEAGSVGGGEEGIGDLLWQSLLEATPGVLIGAPVATATTAAEQAERGEEDAQRPGVLETGLAVSGSFLGFYMGAFGYCATLPRGLSALPAAMTHWMVLLFFAPWATIGGSMIMPILGSLGALALGPFVLWMPLARLLEKRREVETSRALIAAIGGALLPLIAWNGSFPEAGQSPRSRPFDKAVRRQLMVAVGQSLLGGAAWGLVIWGVAKPEALPVTRIQRQRQLHEQYMMWFSA